VWQVARGSFQAFFNIFFVFGEFRLKLGKTLLGERSPRKPRVWDIATQHVKRHHGWKHPEGNRRGTSVDNTRVVPIFFYFLKDGEKDWRQTTPTLGHLYRAPRRPSRSTRHLRHSVSVGWWALLV
jgi:hypothetical protein